MVDAAPRSMSPPAPPPPSSLPVPSPTSMSPSLPPPKAPPLRAVAGATDPKPKKGLLLERGKRDEEEEEEEEGNTAAAALSLVTNSVESFSSTATSPWFPPPTPSPKLPPSLKVVSSWPPPLSSPKLYESTAETEDSTLTPHPPTPAPSAASVFETTKWMSVSPPSLTRLPPSGAVAVKEDRADNAAATKGLSLLLLLLLLLAFAPSASCAKWASAAGQWLALRPLASKARRASVEGTAYTRTPVATAGLKGVPSAADTKAIGCCCCCCCLCVAVLPRLTTKR
mmetsp:Transcript_35651/g.65231  ORF Transcript_35651/g.65231 Transcript_35651/m.65231 type:complete len:283 (+) Transcript_35651:151-999(+)